MIAHHPPLDMLLDHASGALAPALRLVVATHAALCDECRRQLEGFERVGGAMLELMPPVMVREDLLDRVMAAIDQLPAPAAPAKRAGLGELVPAPLKPYVNDNARWQFAGLAIDSIELPLKASPHRASLLRIKAGRAMAPHRHEGLEYTLVLSGAFTDAGARYGVGDLCLAAGPAHRPVAEPQQDCICLAVLDAPLVLTGGLGRLLNPLLRWQHRRALGGAA